ncbi:MULTISPECIES: SDR family oxidoreductase [unclassified Paenibacillus]|uniref:dTDP-4-dehydrorhamnose reductase family protein n=1 Tax=unclassified Paenibacillus TaxID=185978 RepID=UPI001C109CD7|nr:MULTISPECIES: SDR family oxidoreductase [unclassified Paenibacillus]MBU5440830.1 SDR family oxidoreductase [Paenibacillus sp. MSJ-34]CAH0118473.1 hypothetical protein PAE9249_00962 [Paenibacillus sp. CECT 9249]
MKLLVLGGNGMAGHMLVGYFRAAGRHSVFYTTRDETDDSGLLFDAEDPSMVEALVRTVRPDVIVNAIGILNEAAKRNPVAAYAVNGLLPHRLASAADSVGARLIHISTDCVFRGDRGGYAETDAPDGITVYARTKALGEVNASRHLTVRTSIVGPEVRSHCIGLLHWFLRQQGNVRGYRQVLWNGVTTLELAKAIEHWIDCPVNGLVHLVAPERISKLELLRLFQRSFDKNDVEIVPDDEIAVDRTLAVTRSDLDYSVPPYEEMIRELAQWMRSG